MIKIKTITTALLAMALATACTPQAEELADAQSVTLMPTATIVSNGTAAVTRATTNEVGITLTDGTLQLTMDNVKKDYTVHMIGDLTTTDPHKATVGKHAFSVDEAKVTGTIEHENKPLPMNLNVAMTKQDLTVAAGGAVALPLAPTTAGMRLVLKTDEEVKPTTVTCMPSNEVAPKSGETTTTTTASRIVTMTEASAGTPGIYAVAFGMLPAGTKVDAGAPLATIEITGNKTLALLAPAPLTLKAGEMVTYTVHVDHSMASITDVEIGGFTNVDGGSIGVGDNRIAMADGTATTAEDKAALTSLLTNPGKTIWVITGNTADVLTNVRAALDALNNTPAAAGTIDVILPEFAGTIGTGAFHSCAALTSFSAPKATNIGASAFNSCANLTSISLPAATSIRDNAFEKCKALTTISLPAATAIGYSAFRQCGALTTIDLPAAESIGSAAFESCTNLTTISLPAATTIGYNAFAYCTALTRLELTGTTEITVNEEAFNGSTPGNITLVLNSEATNATIGVTVEDATGADTGKKKVTFANTVTLNGAAVSDLSVIFSAVEYIN